MALIEKAAAVAAEAVEQRAMAAAMMRATAMEVIPMPAGDSLQQDGVVCDSMIIEGGTKRSQMEHSPQWTVAWTKHATKEPTCGSQRYCYLL